MRLLLIFAFLQILSEACAYGIQDNFDRRNVLTKRYELSSRC